jgi:hypothetical protein
MKPFSDLGRFSGCWPKTIPVFLAFMMTAAGCGKSSNQPQATRQVPPPSASSTTASSTPAPAPAQSQSVTTAADPNDPHENLQLLNRALIRWMIKNHRHPQNFEDFASSAKIQIPDPPAGKKYTLDGRGFITLVDFATQ